MLLHIKRSHAYINPMGGRQYLLNQSQNHLQLFVLAPPLIFCYEPEKLVSPTVTHSGSELVYVRRRQLRCMFLLRDFHRTFPQRALRCEEQLPLHSGIRKESSSNLQNMTSTRLSAQHPCSLERFVVAFVFRR